MTMATTNPRMTMVSGIASSRMIVPVASGFSAMVPAPAAPILLCASPVPIAQSPTAMAAERGDETHRDVPLLRLRRLLLLILRPDGSRDGKKAEQHEDEEQRSSFHVCDTSEFFEGGERLAASQVELREELHVVQAQPLDGRIDDPEGQVQRVHENHDEHRQHEVAGHAAQHGGKQGKHGGCHADGHDPRVGEDIAQRAEDLQREQDAVRGVAHRLIDHEHEERKERDHAEGGEDGGRTRASRPTKKKSTAIPAMRARLPSAMFLSFVLRALITPSTRPKRICRSPTATAMTRYPSSVGAVRPGCQGEALLPERVQPEGPAHLAEELPEDKAEHRGEESAGGRRSGKGSEQAAFERPCQQKDGRARKENGPIAGIREHEPEHGRKERGQEHRGVRASRTGAGAAGREGARRT